MLETIAIGGAALAGLAIAAANRVERTLTPHELELVERSLRRDEHRRKMRAKQSQPTPKPKPKPKIPTQPQVPVEEPVANVAPEVHHVAPQVRPEPKMAPVPVRDWADDWIDAQRQRRALAQPSAATAISDPEPTHQPAPKAPAHTIPADSTALFVDWFNDNVILTGNQADIITLIDVCKSYGDYCLSIGHKIADPDKHTRELLHNISQFADQGSYTVGPNGEIMGGRIKGQQG